MELRHIQEFKRKFEKERGWDKFPAELVYIHLIEEIGEIGKHILYKTGYKVPGLGHDNKPSGLKREFGQVLSLLLQLANRLDIDLEQAFLDEIKIMENRFSPKEWRRYTSGLNYSSSI